MLNDWEPVSARKFKWEIRTSNNNLIAVVGGEVWNDLHRRMGAEA